jgi:DNA-binding NtrC family response regulator
MTYPARPVLIVDDEKYILESLRGVLMAGGITNLILCGDSRQVPSLVQDTDPVLVLLDLTMPHLSGEELLDILHQEKPELPVIIITGVNELSTAVECMKKGAVDYLVKAIENSKLLSAVRGALKINELREENRRLKATLLEEDDPSPDAYAEILTEDRKMKSTFRYLSAVAVSPHTILLRGETGTGKELIARAVHTVSGRQGAFIRINAAGLDDTMFSDTLFGHKRGAYSGADENRSGLVEKAAEGTLFLDEIGDLLPSSQIKLLRLLEQGEYYPLGSDMLKKATCRIVAATNENLEQLMEQGKFRRDLYYRLAGHEVRLPGLRERSHDIPLLTEHFLESSCAEMNKPVPALSPDFTAALLNYQFPGNIRELQGLIRHALGRHTGGILQARDLDLPEENRERRPIREETAAPSKNIVGKTPGNRSLVFPPTLPTLKECSDELIKEALHRTGGNISRAALLLGISQPALSKRLSRKETLQNE